MYSLDTLRNVNAKAELRHYMEAHPMTQINVPEDALKSPDYSEVNKRLLEATANMEEVEEFFVDSSGLGLDSEPAMTVKRFLSKVQIMINEAKERNEKLYSCITGAGQFQVYVAFFKQVH